MIKGKLNPYDDSMQKYNTIIRKIESLENNCEKAAGTRNLAKANKRLEMIIEWENDR